MSDKLIVYTSDDTFTMNTIFGPIRAKKIDGKVWFVRSDVLEALGISKTSGAITRLSEEGSRKTRILTAGVPRK